MRLVKTVAFLLLLSLEVLYLFPESSAPGTLEECIEIGLSSSKIMQEALIYTRLMREKVVEARTGFLPSLTLRASYQRFSETDPASITLPPPASDSVEISPFIANQYSIGASLRQPLFAGLHLLGNVDKAGEAAERSLYDSETVRLDLIFQIKKAYYNLARAVESQKVIEESLKQMEAHLEDVSNRFAQGLATNHDVLSAEMRLADTRLLRIESENAVQVASINLNILLGLPAKEKIEPALPKHLEETGPEDLDALVDEALRKRPELKSALYQVRESEADISIARSGWYPRLDLTGDYQYARPNPRIFPQQDVFISTWDLGISLSIDPVMFGAVASRTRQARENLARTQTALARLRDEIGIEVMESYLRTEKDVKAIEVAGLMIEQAAESLRITKEKFASGLARPTELLDAEVDLQQARLRHTGAVIDHEIDLAALQRATGR